MHESLHESMHETHESTEPLSADSCTFSCLSVITSSTHGTFWDSEESTDVHGRPDKSPWDESHGTGGYAPTRGFTVGLVWAR